LQLITAVPEIVDAKDNDKYSYVIVGDCRVEIPKKFKHNEDFIANVVAEKCLGDDDGQQKSTQVQKKTRSDDE
jgi:hypothetical protein